MMRPSEKVSFPGGTGSKLVGELELPDREPRAAALFAPCFTCTKDSKAIVRISRALAQAGFAVLRYDVTGIGASEGDFAATTFASQVGDLLAAADDLRGRGLEPRLLVGISLGGAVALSAAGRVPEAAAVATVNAPSDTTHLVDLLLHLAPEIATAGAAPVTLLGRTTRIGAPLLEDLPRHDPTSSVAELGVPLLVLHAPDDTVVPVRHGERLFDAARHPKSLVAVAGADHLLLQPPDAAAWAGRVIATWASAFV